MAVKIALAVCLAACGPALAGAGVTERGEIITIELPAGSIAAGREAFEALKCHVCHSVAGEERFPDPSSAARGPDLGASIRLQRASDVAAAIIAPSHSMSVRTSEAVKEKLRHEDVSPMGDFSSRISVRQLADLLAYLRAPADRR
jgi:hypothetical protein